MKFLIVLAVSVSAVVSRAPAELMDDWNSIAAPYKDECLAKTNPNPKLADNLFVNDKLHDEEHVRCYSECLSHKLGFMTEDGVFVKDVITKKVQHATPEIFDVCHKQFGTVEDLCKRAHRFWVCVTEQHYLSD